MHRHFSNGDIFNTQADVKTVLGPRFAHVLEKMNADVEQLLATLAEVQVRQTQCGVNFFILDSRRVLAPAPKVLGSDIKTHLKSRFCAILKKKGRDVIWD